MKKRLYTYPEHEKIGWQVLTLKL